MICQRPLGMRIALGLLVIFSLGWMVEPISQRALAQTAKSAPANAATATAQTPGGGETEQVDLVWAMAILAAGVITVVGLIIALKINAFIALITAAMVVSLMASGPWAERITRVATAFGESAGKIGIVIGLAAVIGKCMLDSGAADRIVRSFLRLLGQKGTPVALLGSGFILAVPVFFDTVFYLLVPLARSLYRTTQKNYLLYLLAIGAGAAITHTLVPPTPGPLLMAANLGFDIGWMILVGGFVAFFGAMAGLVCAVVANRWMHVPMRQIGSEPDPDPLPDSELPSLWLSLAPVVLPVLLISTNTVLNVLTREMAKSLEGTSGELVAVAGNGALQLYPILERAAEWSGVIGNANFALLVSTVIALWTVAKKRQLSRAALAQLVETSLMSGGVIILITAGGGAFGAMLKEAQVGTAIQSLFAGAGGSGVMLLVLGFGIAAVLKIAQGSSTVAMITGSAMLAGLAAPETLGFHPVYLATAIGGGSLVGSWMNDSGFWIFAKMGGLTEIETLKAWTVTLVVLGFVSLLVSMVMAQLLPLT